LASTSGIDGTSGTLPGSSTASRRHAADPVLTITTSKSSSKGAISISLEARAP
jgi:hypothetical protein